MAHITLLISCACSSFQSDCNTECAWAHHITNLSMHFRFPCECQFGGALVLPWPSLHCSLPAPATPSSPFADSIMLRSHVLLCLDAACTSVRYTDLQLMHCFCSANRPG